MADNPMLPWLHWWAPGRAEPFGGDAREAFRVLSPTVTVNGRGDPVIEREIVEDVATYGAQIGQLTEIVLALAEGEDISRLEALTKLRAIADEIARKKKDYSKNVLERARKALDELREHDPKGYELLVATLGAKGRR